MERTKVRSIFKLIPNSALYESDVNFFGRLLIPNFLGVYNRQSLPDAHLLTSLLETAFVVNLDDLEGEGTHWVAIRKMKNLILYFDSFGDLPPPEEIIDLFANSVIYYNSKKCQNFHLSNCGKLCLEFLMNTI